MAFIDPSELTLVGWDNKPRTYILSRFPCIQGREIMAKYPLANMPKIGEYPVSEDIMLKLMAFVAVKSNEHEIPLNNPALVSNHVPDTETLAKLEWAMLEKNFSFFARGQGLTSLETLVQKVTISIFKTLTGLLAQLSDQVKQPSTNSEPSIP